MQVWLDYLSHHKISIRKFHDLLIAFKKSMPFTKKPLCDKNTLKHLNILATTNSMTKTKTKHLLGL